MNVLSSGNPFHGTVTHTARRLCSLQRFRTISSFSYKIASLNHGPSFPLQTNIVSLRTVPNSAINNFMGQWDIFRTYFGHRNSFHHIIMNSTIAFCGSMFNYFLVFRQTSRDRPKSAPYLRLKNSKKTSKCQSIGELGTLLWKKKMNRSLTMPKKLKEGTLWDFSTSILSENIRKLKGAPFGEKFCLSKKSLTESKIL